MESQHVPNLKQIGSVIFYEWSISTNIYLILQIHLWGSRHHFVSAGDGRWLGRRGDRWGGGVSVLLLRGGCGWEFDDWLLLLRAHSWLVVHYVTHGDPQMGLLLNDTEAHKHQGEIQTQTHRVSKDFYSYCSRNVFFQQDNRLVCVCVCVCVFR